jgi:hypothetical protein
MIDSLTNIEHIFKFNNFPDPESILKHKMGVGGDSTAAASCKARERMPNGTATAYRYNTRYQTKTFTNLKLELSQSPN